MWLITVRWCSSCHKSEVSNLTKNPYLVFTKNVDFCRQILPPPNPRKLKPKNTSGLVCEWSCNYSLIGKTGQEEEMEDG